MTDFIQVFIQQLRAPNVQQHQMFGERAQRLANHLERRVTTPFNDGFDLHVTGDEEGDRSRLAAWLDAAAEAPPFLAPSWTRVFSSAVAWLVRNRHEVTPESALVATLARIDPSVAQTAREEGIPAAYQRVMARRLDD